VSNVLDTVAAGLILATINCPFAKKSGRNFMEIKVGCGCGQNYKFDIEPVKGRMPVNVACPSCGTDGTPSANRFLAQQFPNQAPPIPVALRAQPAGAVRVSLPASAPAAAVQPPIPSTPGAIAPRPLSAASKPKKSDEFSLGLGILGAVLGAALGAGLMYGFYTWAQFRFPLMGTCIGALVGLGARMLARGTDTTLGAIAGLIALISTAGVLYLMYGGMAGMFIITMAVSV
jgi:hypothetical protein